MTTNKQAIGRWGEETAVRFLEKNGYIIVNRNVHSSHGEIDIIALKEGCLVFVEVKTRSSHRFAYPEDAITSRKKTSMLSAAEDFLQKYPEAVETWQFDVIAIEKGYGREPEITHFENVIA